MSKCTNLAHSISITQSYECLDLTVGDCPYCEIEQLNTGIKAAYATLQMYGVPELRAKTVANGIMVLVSRIDKESNFQAMAIAGLKKALKEIVAVGERDSNFLQDGRMYDIAKAALEI